MARRLYWMLVLALIAQAAYYYPRLPERVASHFGAGGQPDGWSTKTSFMLLEVFLVALLGGMFLFIPALIRWIPHGLVNMPNREYWLAPERREATIAQLAEQMLWCGVITLGLMFVIFQWTFQANMTAEPRLPGAGVWIALGIYLAAMTAWVVAFYRSFALPPGETSS